VKPKIAEGDLLHLAIGGVIVDKILVAAKTVARVQDGRMPVGDPRQFIEPAAGERPEPVEMRFQAAEVLRRQVVRQQIAQAAIDGVEILSRTIRRDVIGAAAHSGRRAMPCEVFGEGASMAGLVSGDDADH